MKIESIMTRDVISVAPETPLKEIARLLSSHRISGAPVCDDEGRILGVVSEADILPHETGEPARRLGARILRALGRRDQPASACTARDAMTTPALTVRPLQPVEDAAALMVTKGVNRLPVVVDGGLVGIVSRADLVRAFARSDAEIEREIRDDVIYRILLRSPDEFQVEVSSGQVRIRGRVETEQDAEVLERCIRHVTGVVEVEADVDVHARQDNHPKLTWMGRA